mmetsp:Transcript_13677/g.35189  ORF Transcript_13677/g.35189 Transcript_13677/m.35189 type:complete len:214 (+) Transcript_13677:486-1127(+)
MYVGVPADATEDMKGSTLLSVSWVLLAIGVASPKSPSFAVPSGEQKIFAGFTSLCIHPASCNTSRALATPCTHRQRIKGGSGTVLIWPIQLTRGSRKDCAVARAPGAEAGPWDASLSASGHSRLCELLCATAAGGLRIELAADRALISCWRITSRVGAEHSSICRHSVGTHAVHLLLDNMLAALLSSSAAESSALSLFSPSIAPSPNAMNSEF